MIIASSLSAQVYFANGDAKAIAGQCYQLTANTNWQNGSVWYANKIDLNNDFDLEFYLNFGTSNSGADGIVFVLQNVGNKALGQAGGGLGFEGFSPSLGIEFDDYYNASVGDLVGDHIGVLKNGSVNHNSTNNLANPILAIPGGGNIEDGNDHLVRIAWDVSRNKLNVWFDCVLRQSLTIDIKNSIFSGQNEIFWGFTASTGGEKNTQIACLRDDILVRDTFAICKGDTIALNARESKNNVYSWTPSTFLESTTVKSPRCYATAPMTYYVEFRDLCDNVMKDTVDVVIDEPYTIDEGQDTLLCDGATYLFNLRDKYDSLRWGNGTRAEFVAWSNAGTYSLRTWQGVCSADDIFSITTSTSPTIDIIGDTLFCEGDSSEFSVVVLPSDASFSWSDGYLNDTRYFSETASGSVTAQNQCNTTDESFEVREIVLPEVSLGADTFLCTGTSIELRAPIGPYSYEWSSGENTDAISVSNLGSYWLRIGEANLCYASDTIEVDETNPPEIGIIDDQLLCINEKITLSVDIEHGEVLWNNTVIGDSFTLSNIEGEITVSSANRCGSDSTSFDVTLKECFCEFWYPNAFTPNFDQLNPGFKGISNCTKLRDYRFVVYNRWGELLFETDDPEAEWDGTYKNKPVPQGAYGWFALYSGNVNGVFERKKDAGTVTVIR